MSVEEILSKKHFEIEFQVHHKHKKKFKSAMFSSVSKCSGARRLCVIIVMIILI